ncbi:hypothetical protein NS365_14660 [Aureimonas ureilytica]|uniref:Uncharacterized protein n=1 Tax=Aureimonas ureilytica TaxID=401562 RepID=A0A175RMV9_9HYPH|nr:hypothetical protein [Aureimonas ureilytica]KTR04688.1 hypothetical protein NS365_14660 [Aureimonas ureilytica]
MTANVFNDPDNSVVLQVCSRSSGFIPIVGDGKLAQVRESTFDARGFSPDRSVSDFTLGLAMVGCKVSCGADEAVAV